MERLGLDLVSPADEGGIIRCLGEIEAAKLAQDETVVDGVLGLVVTPIIQMLDREHAQDDLDGRGAPASARRLRVALAQVGFDALKEDIVVEQLVQCRQLWFHFQLQLRYQFEEIHRIIPIDYHSADPPRELGGASTAASLTEARAYFAPKTSYGHSSLQSFDDHLWHVEVICRGSKLRQQCRVDPGLDLP